MRTVIATHARAQLLKLLDSVEDGETITILRRGKAIAVLSPPLLKRGKAAAVAPALRARRKRVLMTDAEILVAANRLRSR